MRCGSPAAIVNGSYPLALPWWLFSVSLLLLTADLSISVSILPPCLVVGTGQCQTSEKNLVCLWRGVQLWGWGLPSLCVAQEQSRTPELLFKTRKWGICISIVFILYRYECGWFLTPWEASGPAITLGSAGLPLLPAAPELSFCGTHVIPWPCFLLPKLLHITTMSFFWKRQLLYNKIHYSYY